MRKKRVKLSQQIRDAIDASGMSRYRISKLTGISEPSLSKFMAGISMLSLDALDVLADALLLNVVAENPKGKTRKER